MNGMILNRVQICSIYFQRRKKRVNSIDDVLQAMEQAKETTFCNRQTGDGDCEDTADKVLELIKHNPQGKYTVS